MEQGKGGGRQTNIHTKNNKHTKHTPNKNTHTSVPEAMARAPAGRMVPFIRASPPTLTRPCGHLDEDGHDNPNVTTAKPSDGMVIMYFEDCPILECRGQVCMPSSRLSPHVSMALKCAHVVDLNNRNMTRKTNKQSSIHHPSMQLTIHQPTHPSSHLFIAPMRTYVPKCEIVWGLHHR